MRRTALAILGAAAATALLASGCTANVNGGAYDDLSKKETITFWHGWSQPNEVNAINANIRAFERLHPNITVKSVGNVTDDTINQALRAGGDSAPDVVSSFSTDKVGLYCASGLWTDLDPFLAKSGIDKAKTFTAPTLKYTAYRGKQCSLPLLGDALGLYYNVDMFKKAGIARPPRTFSEFKADAEKLTVRKGDGYRQLGFMPDYHGYATTPTNYLGQWSPTYLDARGRSVLAKGSAVTDMLTYQRGLVQALGGYDRLEKYRTTFGDEYSTQNAFHVQKVAMQMDGEWRTVNLEQDRNVRFHWATAPMPVPDDQADQYGKGYATGTTIGIAHSSRKQNAAWQFVKFLTTNTKALVSFANAIHNVPTTYASLKSPDLDKSPTFRTFVRIAANPRSSTLPPTLNGSQFALTLSDFAYRVESGKVPVARIREGLKEVDHQIDLDNLQAEM
ncbi:extracellular solute-binding protein [Mangrovactinospora gilvigrisea]|uniref:extracellular solute-binding protein n=1 Tax=Mangrovactinospora gilvigrisea TaxID=1428644 RepID=UPI000A7C49CF|nr:extracellular solute-binding protein [Mangrovactinospora gilvigrisea]